MAAASYTPSLNLVLVSEGGFVNDPRDPGGATNLGITIATLGGWLGRPATVADVRNLSRSVAAEIYRKQFWTPVLGDDLPLGVDYAVFDWAVNSGVVRAAKGLQAALGVTADGHIGLQTLAAARGKNDRDALVRAICNQRLGFMRHLPTWISFRRGWTNRVNAVTASALKMVAAPHAA